MTVDMGGILWPTRTGPGNVSVEPFAATVDKQVPRQGETVQVTGKSGNTPVTDFEVGVQEQGDTGVRWGYSAALSLPAGRYRLFARRRGVTVTVGPLRVL